jgi:integrase
MLRPLSRLPLRMSAPITILSPDEEARLWTALGTHWAEGGFVPLRNRALVTLLWDGGLSIGAATRLRCEHVVPDPSILRVTKELVLGPSAETRYRRRRCYVSERAREALVDYLRVARADDRLAGGKKFKGPLFPSTADPKTSITVQAIRPAWGKLVNEAGVAHAPLEAVVHTARQRLLEAAGGDHSVLTDQTGLTGQASQRYRVQSGRTPEQILRALDKRR